MLESKERQKKSILSFSKQRIQQLTVESCVEPSSPSPLSSLSKRKHYSIDPKQYFVKSFHQKVIYKSFSQCLRIPKKPLSKSPSMAQPTGIAGTINLKSNRS